MFAQKSANYNHKNLDKNPKKKRMRKNVRFAVIGGVVVLIILGVWGLYHFETSPGRAWMRDEVGAALQNAFGFDVVEESSDSSGRYVKLESETGLSFYYYYIPGQIDMSSKEWFQIRSGPQEKQYRNFGHVLYALHKDEIDNIVKKNNGNIVKRDVEAPYHHEVIFSSTEDREAFLSDILEIRDIQLAEKACEETLKEEKSRNNYYRIGCTEMTPVSIGFGGGYIRDIWE